MSRTSLTIWRRLAAEFGILCSYIDTSGKEHFTPEPALRRLLQAFTGELKDSAEAQLLLTHIRARHRQQKLEPVIVCWDEKWPAKGFPEGAEIELEWGEPFNRKSKSLPFGYHILRTEDSESLLLSAPLRFYEPAVTAKSWGLFAPLYAVHSKKSWGAGNFSDWTRFATWAGTQGAAIVGSLPILAAFLDKDKFEPSPYSPASRLFWNEFFVDITALPEFAANPAAKRLAVNSEHALRGFRRAELIDYEKQMQIRRQVLQILAAEFFSAGREHEPAFRQFLSKSPRAREYAEFRARTELEKTSWHGWSGNDFKVRQTKTLVSSFHYHLFSQFAAQRQIDHLVKSCENAGVHFYLDLPLGVNPDGFDAWKFKDVFAKGMNAGAPPDSFFTRGQDWGFPPLDPWKLRESKYQYLIEYLRFQMRHTGMLRLDHVMGLHRLYWVPHGGSAMDGGYVRYPAQELYAILSLESHRNKTLLVGENLGTVPPEVNRSMSRHRMRRMYVLQYEHPAKGVARVPEKLEVASLNTHDMPTFAAYEGGLDIADRTDLKLMNTRQAAAETVLRQKQMRTLKRKLKKEGLLRGETPLVEGALKSLASSNSEMLLVTLEDLWGETRPQNVPGTSSERPNWRRKISRSLEELESDKHLAGLFSGINAHRKK